MAGAFASIYPGWLSDDGSHPYYHIVGPYDDLAWGAYILTGSEVALGLMYFIGGPALLDLKENSTAVSTINLPGSNYYESDITKVGIVGTEINPVLWRLSAGALELDENDVLELVDNINLIRISYLINALLAWDAGYLSLPDVCPYIATWIYFMILDDLWQSYVVEDFDSDGLVPKSMQEYPEADALFYASEASHMEQKDHDNIVRELREAIHGNGPIPQSNPLSVNISGPTALGFKEWGTWTANVSGGFTPYSYQWYKKLGAGTWTTWSTTSSVSYRMGMVDLTLKCVVTDDWNQTDEDTHFVEYGIQPKLAAGEKLP